MKISKVSVSRLHSTNFTDLKFGTVFSDHMLICKYMDGKWGELEIKPYGFRYEPRFSDSSLWTSCF